MVAESFDRRVRLTAFDWLAAHSGPDGDVLSRELLAQGFVIDGQRVPLVAPQGIFKPACLDLPLSITTAPSGPYDDSFGPDRRLRYRYRGTDPEHRDNRGLRELMRRRSPLVYLYGTAPGRYLPIWPAFIVGDHPGELYFDVEVDASPFATSTGISESEVGYEDATELRREYVTTIARRRIHQQAFRERVLHAYRTQCALCRLRHIELLDAAHITPDSDETGEPLVSNGLALCKFHHAAYDKLFLSVTPDYLVQVRAEILAENDGPMLQHGLKELHGIQILLPSLAQSRPDRDRLAARHTQFLKS